MKISKGMLRRHLEHVTLSYLALGDHPSDDLSDFDGGILEMQRAAQATGDLDWIKLALDHLLSTPGQPLKPYGGGQYPYSESDLQDLFQYVWSTLWPGELLSVPGECASIELIEMQPDEWTRIKGLFRR